MQQAFPGVICSCNTKRRSPLAPLAVGFAERLRQWCTSGLVRGSSKKQRSWRIVGEERTVLAFLRDELRSTVWLFRAKSQYALISSFHRTCWKSRKKSLASLRSRLLWVRAGVGLWISFIAKNIGTYLAYEKNKLVAAGGCRNGPAEFDYFHRFSCSVWCALSQGMLAWCSSVDAACCNKGGFWGVGGGLMTFVVTCKRTWCSSVDDACCNKGGFGGGWGGVGGGLMTFVVTCKRTWCSSVDDAYCNKGGWGGWGR